MKGKTLNLTISLVFNIIFLMLCTAILISLNRLSCEWSDVKKSAKTTLQTGVTLASLVEGELGNISRQSFGELLSSIYIVHPEFKSSWTGFRPKEKNCYYYGGVFFVFKEERFAFLDRRLQCDSYSRKWAIYSGFLGDELENDY